MTGTTDAATANGAYDPDNCRLRTFFDARARFTEGSDTPRAFLERCIDTIEKREPEVHAWAALNFAGAREAADRSTERYRQGRPISPIDGMPVGIKDVIQTKDMPTAMGSPIFQGRETNMDSASVDALRLAGASILGKTVTTEFAFVAPGPTRNPFDPGATPGGSSSGSAAAVGAAMVPAALGNQVMGSVIRPASYCANYAIKPTLGALHCGEGLSLSQLHLGVHAASLQDMWSVAYEIAKRAGGDPGHPGLYGPERPPAAMRPTTLIALETEGWALCDERTSAAFSDVVAQLHEQGVVVLTRSDDASIERLERAIRDSIALCRILCSYELRWALRSYKATGLLSDDLALWLEKADLLTPEDYRAALDKREKMRTALAAVRPLADAMITLSSAGSAPPVDALSDSGEGIYAFKTGSPAFNTATSALGAPAVTVPLASVAGLPMGVQLIGHPHCDWTLAGHASWLIGNLRRISV